MNVRVHKRDFTSEVYYNVKGITEDIGMRYDEVVLDCIGSEVRLFSHDITIIEILL